MFTHKKVSQLPRHRLHFLKYLTMFFLGASAVLLVTQAFEITTSLNNAVQYISKIVVTTGGGATGTGIILDGSNGDASFSGNVGIGTGSSSPYLLYLLSRQSTGSTQPDFILKSITSGFIGLYGNTYGGKTKIDILASGLGDALEIYQDITGDAHLMNANAGNFYIGTDGQDDIAIDNHYVGIQTNNPSYTLDVSGDVQAAQFLIKDGGSSYSGETITINTVTDTGVNCTVEFRGGLLIDTDCPSL